MTKTTNETVVARSSSGATTQIVFGYILAILGGIFAFTGITTTGLSQPIDWIMVSLMLLLTAVGVWMILRGKKRKKLIRLFREYAPRLAADPQHSIERLAKGLSAPTAAVERDLMLMIRKGYFINAYIGHDHRLVFTRPDAMNAAQQSAAQPDYRVFVCPDCGGRTKIPKGTVGECEYCGNPIREN